MGSRFLDLLAVGVSKGSQVVPPALLRRAGGTLGRCLGAVSLRKRRRILGNLAAAGVADPKASCRVAWSHAGQTMFEMLWMLPRGPKALMKRVEVHGVGPLADTVASGRGVLLVSAHVGNWELVSLAAASAGLPTAVVARPLRAAGLERRLIEFRRIGNVQTFLRGAPGASVAAYRWLASGKVLGCMMDRSSGGRRMSVPFCGRSTRIPLGPLEFAVRSKAAIFLGMARRKPDGTASVAFRRLPTDGVLELTELGCIVGRELEAEIRPRPESWLWIYRTQALEAAPAIVSPAHDPTPPAARSRPRAPDSPAASGGSPPPRRKGR